jgi:SAM-dependent methyltransferase
MSGLTIARRRHQSRLSAFCILHSAFCTLHSAFCILHSVRTRRTATLPRVIFGRDLALVHDAGFRDADRIAPAIVDAVRRRGFSSGTVTELGCGSGRTARHLVGAGYRVIGSDISPAMIALARERVPEAHFTVSGARSTDLSPSVAITAIGEVLSYEDPAGGSLYSLFQRAAAALPPGGLLLFDVLVSDGGEPMETRYRHEGDGWIVEVDVSEEQEQRVVERRIVTTTRAGSVWRRSDETHRLDVMSINEIGGWLRDAGFSHRVSDCYGDFELPPRRAAFTAVRMSHTR